MQLYELMCEGNYKHNVEVLKGNKVELIVLKRPAKDTDVKAFGPCYACKGFVICVILVICGAMYGDVLCLEWTPRTFVTTS